MKRQRLYSILFLFFAFLPVSAIPPITVEHYTVNRGLPSNLVYCSLKDSDGFMWFGTLYGLCSFDGIKFKIYNNHDGFFYSENPPRKIQTIAEDKNGFLWIKTADEKAYVFDRKKERFHLLCNEAEKHTEGTTVIKIQKTPDGEIFILTGDKKLLCACTTNEKPTDVQLLHDLTPSSINEKDSFLTYNVLGETNEFINWIGADYHIYSYRKGTDLAKKHSNVILAEIGMDILKSFTCAFNGENRLWVGDNAGRIYCIDPETGIVNKYKLPDIDEAIQNLFVSSNNETVYVYTKRGGMYEYNVKNDQLQRHLLNLNGAISYAFVDKYDKIWLIENENALLYYDPQNKIEKRFPVLQGRHVTDMQVRDVGEQGLFILTPAGEMLIFERESLSMTRLNQATSFPAIPQTPLFFNQEFDDDDGMLWLSSSSGIYCVNFLPKQFRLFGLQTFKRATLYTEKEVLNPSINALFRAQNGDIWIGTQQNLYLIDKSGQLKEVFMTLTHPTISNVCHIMEDNKGNLWFSTKGEGVIKAIPDAQALYGFRFVRYTNNPEVLSSLGSNNVRFTFQDSKDRIWLGLLNGGLNLLQEEADKVSFKHKYNGFKQYPLSYSSYMEVRGMVEDTDGRIWVGTTDGLMSFEVNFDEPEDIVFETYLNQNSASPICNDNISMLYKDTDSRIWVGLFGGGLGELIGYDREAQKPIFKSYGARNGLRNDVIVSIAEDDSRNLWFVTENGISCLDKQTERFRNYDRLDGFPDITLGEIQALISSKGEFWFGCKEGILAFSPDKLETHKYNYKTYILDFRINGKENPPMDTPIKYASEVEVEHDQSTFTIEFVALDYSNRDNISYEYILEGYEKEWHFNGNNRIASYTGVSPGKYKFRVRSINEVDSESLSESTLTIRILPPWKSSWYTYALYIIIIGIIAIISKLVMMLIKAKNEAYIKRRLSELKIKFFTYISHEMRIPLTLIKSPIQELKKEKNLSPKGRKYIGLMEKNTDQMLQLLNQILDFRKVQHDKIRLNISQINLNRMMESFYKEFRALSEESEVAYSFQLTDEVITIWADKEKLSLVIRNIVSNAFKFTPSGQSITVSTGISDDGKKYYIKVEGNSIPENELPKILKDVPQDDHSWNPYRQGTGIGLTLSEELINLHHGSIIIESNEDHGTVFTIELLSDKKHYNFSEVNFIDVDDDNELERVPPSLRENKQQKQQKIKEDSLQLTEKDRIFKKKNDLGEHIGDFFEDTYPIVLLIEDNKDLADLFNWQLEGRYHVGIVANVEEGVKKINQYHPDIVIIDQMLSKISSMKMLKRIQKDFRISHIPVVILSVEKDNDNSRIKFLNMGVSAYITGPIEKEYLIAQLEHLLKKRQQFRERVWSLTDIEKLDSYRRYLTKRDVQLLEKLVRIINKNLSNSNFNLDEIISDTKLDRLAFFKKLKGLTGFAPTELIKEARLNKSTGLLKTTDMSLPEIAFALGFKDLEDYEKCFFAKYNQTPTRYKNTAES